MALPHLYPRTPLILGHRGASAYAPENTLAAFRRSLELGAEGVELDVTLSADGVLVVIHDDTVDRTTNGAGRVNGLTLAQLKKLDAGYPARFGGRFAGERIPTLEEVFAELDARAIVNVELKEDTSPKRELAEKVAQVIRARSARGVGGGVLLSSFYYDNLQRVKQLDPELPVGLLYDPTEPSRMLRAWLRPGVRPEAHHPYYLLLNPLTLRWYHSQGLRVNVWTVNAEADLRRMARLGVDGIITDCPDVAVRIREDIGIKPRT